MKKIFVIVGLFVAGMTVNAQLYMGGSAVFNFKTTDYEANIDSRTTLSMSLYPELGFFLSDRFSLGAEVGFGIQSDSYLDETTINFRFIPYARLSLFQAGKFEVLGKGSVNTDFKKNYTYFGIHIDPILAYNVNEKIILQANLNFLSLRTYYEGNKDNNSSIGFGFGVDANNVATLGSLRFGFIYKF